MADNTRYGPISHSPTGVTASNVAPTQAAIDSRAVTVRHRQFQKSRPFLFGVLGLAVCQCSKSLPDERSFSLELRRTGCLGTCPVYVAKVDATGLVSFEGSAFVKKTGAHQWHLSAASRDAIYRNIDDRQIFLLTQSQLDHACKSEASDMPTVSLALTRGSRRISLTDPGNCESSGPIGNFRRFCAEVDEVLGTTQLFCSNATSCKEM